MNSGTPQHTSNKSAGSGNTPLTQSGHYELDEYLPQTRHATDLADDLSNSGLHWQLPSTPFEMRIDMSRADANELELIGEELELDADDLDPLEIYAERVNGNLLYISFNDVRFESVDDIPPNLKGFLDNIQFGDTDSHVVASTGEVVNFWDALHGDPETLSAFNQYDYEISNSEVELIRGFGPAETLERYDSTQYKKLQDSTEDKVMHERLEQYFAEREAGEKNSRRKLLIGFFIAVAVSGSVALMAAKYFMS